MGYSALIALTIISTAAVSESFLSKKRTDCIVSQWSPWSEPYGFGTVKRERKVLRYPQRDGRRCPRDLTQRRNTGRRPSLKQTANSMADNFMMQNTESRGRKLGALRDLLIIVDSSGSIGKKNFKDAKKQLARLLGMLCPLHDPFKGYQQAAVLEYSDKVKRIFDFNDKKDTRHIQKAIRDMPYMGDNTCTAKAFDYARKKMFTPEKGMRNRPDVKQEVLILSDGHSNCGDDARKAVKRLKKKVDVYGLMIGDHSSDGKKELTRYVSKPINKHLFSVKGYQDLRKLVDYIKSKVERIKCAPFDI